MNLLILPYVFVDDYELPGVGSAVSKSLLDGYSVIVCKLTKMIKELPLDYINKFEK